MGTEYYELKKPVTSIDYRETEKHVHLIIFCNHANCGSITLSKGEESEDFLNLFRGKCVAKTSFIKEQRLLKIFEHYPFDDVYLLSADNSLTTLKKLKEECI